MCYNTLVVLRAYPKKFIFSRYAETADEVISEWTSIFGTHPAHSGNSVSDYISEPFWDMDNEKN
jgi:hypothetical protein